jgi:hypothetical protein
LLARGQETNVRDFVGGIAIMMGIGFVGWGLFFLLRFPGHGEGKMAVILGASAILIGIMLVDPFLHGSK